MGTRELNESNLTSLLLSIFDYFAGWEVHEQKILDNLYFVVQFDNRASFKRLGEFLDGQWGSDLEDNHNVFDLNPFYVDVSYSEMSFKFSEKPTA